MIWAKRRKPAGNLDDRLRPVMSVGLHGFDDAQRRAIVQAMRREAALPTWTVSDVRSADALCVNGARCELTPGGHLRVGGGNASEEYLDLDVQSAGRPVAFAIPMACSQLEPLCTFLASDPAGLRAVLGQFDGALQYELALFTLGAQALEWRERFSGKVVHVSCAGQLLAVIDFGIELAGISPNITVASVKDAQWGVRPASAGAPPGNFLLMSPTHLICSYLRRCESDMLPPVYRERQIILGAEPRFLAQALSEPELMLLRELKVQPHTFTSLRAAAGMSEPAALRALASLHYAGAVATVARHETSAGVAGAVAAAKMRAVLSRVHRAAERLRAAKATRHGSGTIAAQVDNVDGSES